MRRLFDLVWVLLRSLLALLGSDRPSVLILLLLAVSDGGVKAADDSVPGKIANV